MAKGKKGKKVDLEKKAALQARKEAKADKTARKRLDKEAKSNDSAQPHQQNDSLDSLLLQYSSTDRKALASAQVQVLSGFPLARANASLTLYDDVKKKHAELYLFGGEFYNGVDNIVLDHLLSYNPTKQEWKQIHTPISPPPRCAHSCVYYNHALYVFGGEVTSANDYHHYKDLWRFDLKTLTWQEIKPPKAVGTHPSARSGQTALVWKQFMIVFGGFYEADTQPKWFHDVCILDLRTHTWLEIPHSKWAARPEPRSGCNAVILENAMIVHGGFSKLSSSTRGADGPTVHLTGGTAPTSSFRVPSETKVHNDAWRLNLQPLLAAPTYSPPTWERLTSTIARTSLMTMHASSPNGRAGTSSVAFRDKMMLCFGGVVDEERVHHRVNSIFYGDLFGFDPNRRKWFPIQIHNNNNNNKSGGRRRRRKPPENRSIQETQEEQDGESEGDEEDDEIIDLEQHDEETTELSKNDRPTESGWDLEKLRSNMFAFIDGQGNVVYEKFEDSDDEGFGERASENEEKDEEKEEEDDDEEDEEKDEQKEETEETKESSVVEKPRKNGKTSDGISETGKSGSLVSSSSVMVMNPETNQPEAVSRQEPLPRINAKLAIAGNTLYVYGGLLEIGDREVTMDDMWSIDLKKRDKWNCIWGGSMHKQVWKGAIHDDDDSYYSNNDNAAEGEDDDPVDGDEKDDTKQAVSEKTKRSQIRARMKEIVEEFDMSDEQKTPHPGESLADFYARTCETWNAMVKADSSKEVRREGFTLAQSRYEKLDPAIKELDQLDRSYKELKLKDKS